MVDLSGVPKTPLDRINTQLGKRLGQRLLENMLGGNSQRSGLTPTLLLAWFLASLVYVLTFAAIVYGGWLIWQVVTGKASLILFFVGTMLLGLGVLGLPKPGKLEEQILSRQEYPQLYALLERVARAIGERRIPTLSINSDFNAFFGRFGWQQKPHIGLGLPLWTVLTAQERVALLAHELGHSVNGDHTRGFFCGMAVQTLGRWWSMLHPNAIFHNTNAFYGFLSWPIIPLLYVFQGLIYLLLLALGWAGFHNSRRAEYQADAIGAAVAGKDAAISSNWKLLLSPTVREATQRTVLERREDFFTVFADVRQRVPAREFERLRRVCALEGTRLDHTHPQNADRLKFLQSLNLPEPLVLLNDAENRAIDVELERVKPQIERKVISQFRDMMYAG